MTAQWGFRETYPRGCMFCHHQQLADGICKCTEDCPTCWTQGCCGQINLLTLPRAKPEPEL